MEFPHSAATVTVRKLYFDFPSVGGSRAGDLFILLGSARKDFFMANIIKKLLIIFLGVGILFGFVSFIGLAKLEKTRIEIPIQKPPSENLSYKGINGVDALTILREREKAWIEQDSSGLVISINGRRADSSKHEYWAFYVNNKLAPVGPADYITKIEDLIEWKIEKY